MVVCMLGATRAVDTISMLRQIGRSFPSATVAVAKLFFGICSFLQELLCSKVCHEMGLICGFYDDELLKVEGGCLSRREKHLTGQPR
jgi:hypothetical protein